MASEELYRLVKEFQARPPRGDTPVEELRSGFDHLARSRFTLPEGVSFEAVDAGGVSAEWNVPRNVSPQDPVILYTHGGGYSIGSIATHRGLTARLAQAANGRVLSIDYRLAPENRFPAAVEDAVAAYRWLLRQGIGPERVVFAGDSAGGGLALAAMIALREQGEALPTAAVCMSPLTDLAHEGESMRSRAELDPLVQLVSSVAYAHRYVGHDGDLKAPLASPLYADLRGLPPTLILVDTWETLLDDSTRWAERAKAAGCDVTIEVWEEMIHIFPIFSDELPEARQAIVRMGEYIRQKTAAR
jgi:monoterpene epsilon-lactone hydrolase